MFLELGKVIYTEGHLQDIYASIGLPRPTNKMRLVLQEYSVLRERGLAISQRLANYTNVATSDESSKGNERECNFCRVHLSTMQKRQVSFIFLYFNQ